MTTRTSPLADGAGSYAGPLGLLVILLLGVATVFLIRSMSSKITHLPKSFDDTPEDGSDPDDLAG
jgi:hypothetical protein